MKARESELAAHIAEFWVFDEGFRKAVNDGETLEIRSEIFSLYQKIISEETDGSETAPLAKLLGEVTKLQSKSPVRKQFLAFLRNISADPRFARDPKSRHEEPDEYLSRAEARRKSEAKSLYDSGNYAKAVEIALSMITLNARLKRHPGMLGFIMNGYHRMRDSERALEYAEKLIALKPTDKKAYSVAIIAAQSLEDWEKALSLVERSLTFEPDNIIALSRGAAIAKKLGRHEEALKYAEKHLLLEPDDVVSPDIAVFSAYTLKRHAVTLAIGRKLAKVQPDNSALLGMLLFSAFALDCYTEALEYAEKILTLEPHSEKVLAIAASSAISLKFYEKAFRYAQRVHQAEPDNREPIKIMAFALLGLNRRQEAAQYFEELDETIPNSSASATSV